MSIDGCCFGLNLSTVLKLLQTHNEGCQFKHLAVISTATEIAQFDPAQFCANNLSKMAHLTNGAPKNNHSDLTCEM